MRVYTILQLVGSTTEASGYATRLIVPQLVCTLACPSAWAELSASFDATRKVKNGSTILQ